MLRDKDGVTGTATAASIWNIGIVGAAVGFELYHIAIVLTLVNLLTLKVLTPWKHRIDAERKTRRDVEKGG
ncbi:MAG: MgtC/SapB family protein [Acidobacteriota bacterium]